MDACTGSVASFSDLLFSSDNVHVPPPGLFVPSRKPGTASVGNSGIKYSGNPFVSLLPDNFGYMCSKYTLDKSDTLNSLDTLDILDHEHEQKNLKDAARTSIPHQNVSSAGFVTPLNSVSSSLANVSNVSKSSNDTSLQRPTSTMPTHTVEENDNEVKEIDLEPQSKHTMFPVPHAERGNSLSTYSLKTLKDMCKEAKLPWTGRRAELMERLAKHCQKTN